MSDDQRNLSALGFLSESIQARLNGNMACGVDDPYHFDVEARAKYEAYLALGGTPEEAQAEWKRVYTETPVRLGGGSA